jgi:hypothetical protein
MSDPLFVRRNVLPAQRSAVMYHLTCEVEVRRSLGEQIGARPTYEGRCLVAGRGSVGLSVPEDPARTVAVSGPGTPR